MFTDFDATNNQPGSPVNTPANVGRSGNRPKVTPAQRRQRDLATEAREFLDALMVYPVGCQFNLWNLQGDMGIRFSCNRRGKVPAELDFVHEIALAKEFGWLKELDEDIEFTEREQREDGFSSIRYGQRFVRTASNSVIKAERERFIGELVAARRSNHAAGASNT